MEGNKILTAESVEGTSLSFQGVDDVHGSDGLPLGMLGVGDSIMDKVLKEDLVESHYPRALPPLHRRSYTVGPDSTSVEGCTLYGFGG